MSFSRNHVIQIYTCLLKDIALFDDHVGHYSQVLYHRVNASILCSPAFSKRHIGACVGHNLPRASSHPYFEPCSHVLWPLYCSLLIGVKIHVYNCLSAKGHQYVWFTVHIYLFFCTLFWFIFVVIYITSVYFVMDYLKNILINVDSG